MAETLIPFNFGPSGSRSLNNILYGPQPVDLFQVQTGTPTTPEQFISNSNTAALQTIEVARLEGRLPSGTPSIQQIGLSYGVSQETINRVAASSSIQLGQNNRSRQLDRQFEIASSVSKGVIASVFAFLGSMFVAPYLAAPVAASESEAAVPLTYTQVAANASLNAVPAATSGFAASQYAQAVVQALGNRIGGGLVRLLSGDFVGAFNTFTAPTQQQPSILSSSPFTSYGNSGGGGSGSGLGIASNTGQSQQSSLVYPVLGLAAIVLLLVFVRKK